MKAMNHLKFLLLLTSVCAAPREGEMPPQQMACSGQADTQPLYLGVFLATDFSFRSCSPYKTDSMLQDYLKAFVGGMALYFQDTSPAIKLSYLGSRNLTEEEERDILGIKENEADTTVKGADAIKALIEVTINENFIGDNKLFLVLTGFNITEEETKHKANGNAVIPTSGGSSDEDYDDYMSLSARSGSKKNVFQNVPGLSQYGSICGMSSAIVQDFGSNFSGIPSAALQVATVLGPKYKGNISRRTCPEYEVRPTKFYGDECYRISNYGDQEAGFECLDEPITGAETELMTPKQFYAKYSSWTPCRTSYLGSQECQKSSKSSSKKSKCTISCCAEYKYFKLNLKLGDISAPDGENCDANKICVGGKCVVNTKSIEGK
uniref:Putative secreted metalloprotease n=1 Tax=Ixodes ricinus TaxID=34613 RepID=A0A6B0VBI9_IXORI